MTRFSANLGFMWTDRTLPEAIYAAKAAGFDAVECHFPYDTPASEVIQALKETGLKMLGLNTIPGNPENGDNGLAALPDRIDDARRAIDQAISYAAEIGTPNIHVLAGKASGEAAHAMFISNLIYATQQAAKNGQTILIEPLNKYAAPGYFLTTTQQASNIIEEVDANNLKLMFDCYHVQLMEGDLSHRFEQLLPLIGHVQFASVPDRGEPDDGEVNYRYLFKRIRELGYTAPLGAEYRPKGDTDATLGWMKSLV
ncbi:MAG: TIM barrel protein [Rhizobiaceae bacterium]